MWAKLAKYEVSELNIFIYISKKNITIFFPLAPHSWTRQISLCFMHSYPIFFRCPVKVSVLTPPDVPSREDCYSKYICFFKAVVSKVRIFARCKHFLEMCSPQTHIMKKSREKFILLAASWKQIIYGRTPPSPTPTSVQRTRNFPFPLPFLFARREAGRRGQRHLNTPASRR